MVIYMNHPKHGNKVACSNEEALYDESNGWTRFTVGKVEATPEPVSVAVEPDVRSDSSTEANVDERTADAGIEDLRAKYKEKFGKKAHPRKSAETLKKELA